jgi:hypothetical protein
MEALYRAYESQAFRAPQSEEIEAIDWLLQRDDHAFLRLLHVCWTDRRGELYRELQLLGDDEYRQFVQTALHFGFVEPWALPIPGRGDAFLDVYLDSTGPPETGLVALVQALLRVGEAGCLGRLAPYVQAQPERELRALARTVAKRPDVPEPFRKAISDAVAALPAGRAGLLAQLLDDWATWFER